MLVHEPCHPIISRRIRACMECGDAELTTRPYTEALVPEDLLNRPIFPLKSPPMNRPASLRSTTARTPTLFLHLQGDS
jgi:hypothetical protein